MTPTDTAGKRGVRIDWAAGGWVLVLTLVLMSIVVYWRVSQWRLSPTGAIGNGRDAATYGFDLASWDGDFPRGALVGSGQPKDGLPALITPEQMTADEVDTFNLENRGKYLIAEDVVIGVVVGAEARAYPFRVMNWHEIVNDVVGGMAIAVTYSPLTDSVVVFDRTIGGEVVEFGVSGLLLNSNTVLFDRRAEPAAESLWSQLAARSVSGPAAGQTLSLLPFEITSWGDWRDRHPGTTVPLPGEYRLKRYQRNPYGSYYQTRELRFPVEPLPDEGSSPMRTWVAIGQPDQAELILADATATRAVAYSLGDHVAVRLAEPAPMRTGLEFAMNSLVAPH